MVKSDKTGAYMFKERSVPEQRSSAMAIMVAYMAVSAGRA